MFHHTWLILPLCRQWSGPYSLESNLMNTLLWQSTIDGLCVNTLCLLLVSLPSSFQGSQHSGSSLSLASTKVCSSMDDGDGPGSEGNTPQRTSTYWNNTLFDSNNLVSVYNITIIFFLILLYSWPNGWISLSPCLHSREVQSGDDIRGWKLCCGPRMCGEIHWKRVCSEDHQQK